VVTLAGDFDFFAPQVTAGITAVFLARFDATPSWDMRALTLFVNFHFYSFLLRLLFSMPVAHHCTLTYVWRRPIALIPHRYCGDFDHCVPDQSGHLHSNARWFGIWYEGVVDRVDFRDIVEIREMYRYRCDVGHVEASFV